MSTANPPAALALGTARHPFRAGLPRRVLRRLPQFEPEVLAKMAAAEALAEHAAEPVPPAAVVRRRLISPGEVRDFLLAYIACFVAVSAFIG